MTTIAPETNPEIIDTTDTDGRYVGVHVIRPVVGVNLNANQDGTPKTLSLGGATRMRISSQAKKRAVRDWILSLTNEHEQAVRTNRIPGAAAEALADNAGVDFEDALNSVIALLVMKGSGAPAFTILAVKPTSTREGVFAPRQTPQLLAKIAQENWDDLADARAEVEQARASAAEKIALVKSKKEREEFYLPAVSNTLGAAVRKQVGAAFSPGSNVEIALAGRMLTALPNADVDGAMSVAHCYTVDPIQTIRDEWTWKDDWQDGGFEESSSGAGSLGDTVLGSGTFYEWAALDREQLRANLREHSGLEGAELDAACADAERLFVSAFANASPSGHSRNTGSQPPFVLAVGTVSDRPPLTLPVFERPVTEDTSYTAAQRVADYLVRAQRRHPVNGGIVLWEPGLPAEVPEFPATLTVEA